MPQIKLSIVMPIWIPEVKKPGCKGCKSDLIPIVQACLNSVRRHTKVPYELILIDNGSVHFPWKGDVRVVNPKNLGFAPACNQGFKLARGEYIACMNDDIIVGENWAENMIEAIEGDIGIVMPALMTHKPPKGITKEAEIKKVQDASKMGVRYFPVNDGWGSLWMTKKEYLDKIGLFDEKFEMGMYEDKDMWRRYWNAGLKTARTHKTWVYHVGNATWGKLPNAKELFYKNKDYYEDKWK